MFQKLLKLNEVKNEVLKLFQGIINFFTSQHILKKPDHFKKFINTLEHYILLINHLRSIQHFLLEKFILKIYNMMLIHTPMNH